MKKILLSLAALGAALGVQAKVVLPGIFGDNMVLQQQSEAQFWGKAAPGKKVTIRPSWSTKSITADVGKDGRWRAAVPTPEAGGPYTVELSDGERLTLRDVLIGEVWLCSGQSNMEMPVRGFFNQPVEGSADAIMRAKAATPIRLCTVNRATARTPQEECTAQWLKHTPEAVAGTSATAYFFAQYLQSVLDVPVGVIVTCSGMFAGYFVGMKVFKMNILECLGGICGGMTSTPALGAIASKTDSQAPVVSYATAYPVALILMTIIAKVIIQTIGGVVGV